MKSLLNNSLELLLAAIWISVAKLIILSGNTVLLRDIFNWTQKKHRYYYDQLTWNDNFEAVHKHPIKEFITRAIAVTYVRYACMPNRDYFN